MIIKFVPIHNITLAAGFLCVSSGTEAATWYVNNANVDCATTDGSAAKPFCTIQAAVDKAAASGDTVQVAAGNYDPVYINNKSLKLLGANPTTTTIRGYSYGVKMSGFTAGAPGMVEIANFAITGTSGGTNGVWAESRDLDVNVHNCTLSNNDSGVYATSFANVGVTNSVINSNYVGVHAYNGGKAQVTSSIIEGNEKGVYCFYYNNRGSIGSYYNTYFENTIHRVTNSSNCVVTTSNDKDSIDPLLNTDYTLQSGSPAIDAGSPVPAERDLDGSRNDQGIHGGPGAAALQYSLGRPVVTTLTITPSNVSQDGTFTLQATGQAQ